MSDSESVYEDEEAIIDDGPKLKKKKGAKRYKWHPDETDAAARLKYVFYSFLMLVYTFPIYFLFFPNTFSILSQFMFYSFLLLFLFFPIHNCNNLLMF